MSEVPNVISEQDRKDHPTPIATIDVVPNELLTLIFSHLVRTRTDVLESDISKDRWTTSPLDKRDLSAASTVSRRFRACALPHLFRDVVVHYTFSKFLAANPHVCAWIVNLSLLNTGPETVMYEIRHELLAQMPQLRVLALVDGFVMPSVDAPRLNVDILHFIVTHYTEDTIRDTFQCFSVVKRLHLELNERGLHVPQDMFEGVTIQSLSLGNIDSFPHLVDALLFSATCRGLKSFVVRNVWNNFVDDAVALPRLLHAVSDSLVFLELGCPPMSLLSENLPSSFTNLHWPALRSLNLAFLLLIANIPSTYTRTWQHLSHLLATFAPCDTLRRVALSICYPSFGAPPALLGAAVPPSLLSDDIARVEEALLRFRNLESVTILNGNRPPPRPEQLALSERMPKLKQSGVLNFRAESTVEDYMQ